MERGQVELKRVSVCTLTCCHADHQKGAVDVPADAATLVCIIGGAGHAYICWEKAGQPQGADFADEARRVIEDRVRGGATYEQLAKEMNLEPTWKKVGSG
eukprot:1161294-Pelagomonas_calceolata.AAC.3